jgi:hypothetical protein
MAMAKDGRRCYPTSLQGACRSRMRGGSRGPGVLQRQCGA